MVKVNYIKNFSVANFDSYRRWFNRNFKFSFDGKYKGLSTILKLFGERFVCHLTYKLFRYLTGDFMRQLDSAFKLRLGGHTFKFYSI